MNKDVEELSVEILDDEGKDSAGQENKIEKIEIIEKKESQFDDVLPREVMSDMSKEEKDSIRERVLKEDKEELVKIKEEVNVEKVGTLSYIVLGVVILVFIVLIFLFYIKNGNSF